MPPTSRRPLLVGVSACILHADPARSLYKGKTLQYAEPSVLHWLNGAGAISAVIPAPDASLHAPRVDARDYATRFDALVLEGGADMAPGAYGETPLKPQWSGDAERDAFEIALLRAFTAAGKPVLGVCRGLQVINVALGGTLYQDLPTQHGGTIAHRDAERFEHNRHAVRVVAGTRLSALMGTCQAGDVSSIHHQAIRRLAPGLVVEAHADDGVIEAIRGTGPTWLAAVQWHPEFHPPGDPAMLSAGPMLADFLAAAATVRDPAARAGTR